MRTSFSLPGEVSSRSSGPGRTQLHQKPNKAIDSDEELRTERAMAVVALNRCAVASKRRRNIRWADKEDA